MSLLSVPCFAEVPKLIEYIGTVQKANGSPYQQGVYDITFQICTDEACTNTLWSETHTVEISAKNKKDIDGGTSYEAAFKVILGSIDPLDSLAFDQDYYLSISEATLGYSNTEQILSAPYSLRSDLANYAVTVYDSDTGEYTSLQDIEIKKAKDADTVDGFHASDTPTANTLLALDGSVQIPDSVVPDNITINMAKDSEKLGGQIPSYYAVATEAQKRVTGTCGHGSSIRVINEDGSVVCEPDDALSPNGTYNGMSVGYALNGGNANYANSAGFVNLIDNSNYSKIRDCCNKSTDGDLACLIWPFSITACKNLACTALYPYKKSWQVNEFDKYGNWVYHTGGNCF